MKRFGVAVVGLVALACARERSIHYPAPTRPPPTYGASPTPAPAGNPTQRPAPTYNPWSAWTEAGARLLQWRPPPGFIPPIPPGWIPPGVMVPGAPASGGTPSGGWASGQAAGARYGHLSGGTCLTQLTMRGVAYRSASAAPGVDTPIRLAGPLHGVPIISVGANKVGTNSSQDILDCRLALALDDFSRLLAARGIVRVDHMSLYRSRATIAGRGTVSQHAFGLAIDIGSLRYANGQRLVVQRDWTTERGSFPCPGPLGEGAAGAQLREIVCSSLQEGVFNTFITPNHNAAHDNHFHFDVIVGERGVFAE